jgi:hypothetical protein
LSTNMSARSSSAPHTMSAVVTSSPVMQDAVVCAASATHAPAAPWLHCAHSVISRSVHMLTFGLSSISFIQKVAALNTLSAQGGLHV